MTNPQGVEEDPWSGVSPMPGPPSHLRPNHPFPHPYRAPKGGHDCHSHCTYGETEALPQLCCCASLEPEHPQAQRGPLLCHFTGEKPRPAEGRGLPTVRELGRCDQEGPGWTLPHTSRSLRQERRETLEVARFIVHPPGDQAPRALGHSYSAPDTELTASRVACAQLLLSQSLYLLAGGRG